MPDGALMTLDAVQTARLLPGVLTSDADVQSLLHALDGQWHDMALASRIFPLLATLDQQASDVVDALAYQFHVDYYTADMSLETRREMVRQSIHMHQYAGTRGAVEDLVRTIWGDGASLSEWFETDPPLEPGTFLVRLDESLSEVDLSAFLASLRAVKRATDHVLFSTTSGGAEEYAITTYTGAVYSQCTHLGRFEVE